MLMKLCLMTVNRREIAVPVSSYSRAPAFYIYDSFTILNEQLTAINLYIRLFKV